MEETKILVVEDEAITAMDIKSRLSKLQYNVIGVAFSGEEAIDITERLNPTLVLMDIVLKGSMDGTQTGKLIAQRFNIPIIYLTAYSDDETFNRAKLSLPYGYITKPFETRDLRISVELAVYRHEMEKKLALAETHYRILMENASCGFFIHDKNGIIYDINKEGEKIFGVDKHSLFKKDFRHYIVPEEQEYVSVQLKKLNIERKTGPNMGHIIQPSGKIREVEFSSVCVDSGNDLVYLSIINDMTDRNKLRSQSLLADKLASVGTLAVGIIHEVNNPLSWIMSNFEFIQEKLKNLHDINAAGQKTLHECNQLINESIQGAEHIADIIKQLKGFSHQDEETLVPIDVHHALNAAIKIASYELQKHAALETDFNEKIPLLLMSNNKLQQVFLNIIINAIQALPLAKKQENLIKIKTVIEKNNIRIDIKDNGPGISPGHLKKIFEPFFTTKPEGTGLGLPICYDIIHDMGGNIIVQSEVNQGTTFSISLPVQVKALMSSPAKKIVKPKRRLNILIVDDTPMLLKTLHRLLSDDHDVTDALGGREALTLLENHGNEFDLMISDVHMPDINGIDLYRYLLQKIPKLAEHSIFVSGGSFSSDTADFDIVKHLSLNKPFTSEELFSMISLFYP